MLSWSASGKGECTITLQDAQQLAVEAEFTFKGSHDRLPLARRADLQAMFERFGVNSLSAFRHKFWAYELDPAVGGSRIGQPASALSSPPTSSGSRSRWQVQQLGKETYVGEMMDGRRHGCGILLVKGERSSVLHVGQFSQGLRNGPGLVASSRGERFEGHFLDDVMWGPGEFAYAAASPPQATSAEAAEVERSSDGSGLAGAEAAAEVAVAAAAAGKAGIGADATAVRVAFRGMMNGRPLGKGCMTWNDGSQQVGQFDGNNCYLRLQEEEVAGVLMVAADNAKAARAAAAQVQQQAARQQQHISQQAQQLFAAVVPPQQPAVPGGSC